MPRRQSPREPHGEPSPMVLRGCVGLRAERLAAALEAGGLGVWEIDRTSGALILSAEARALLRLPAAGTVTVRAALRRLRAEDRGLVRAAARRWLGATAPVEIDLRFRLADGDGVVRWVAVRGRTVGDDGGARDGGGAAGRGDSRVGAIGVIRDVTERETLLRQKDALMAEINHRTKNSLQLVASLLRLESRDIGDPEGRRRFVEASTRVNSIAAVHDGLDRTADLRRVHLVPLVRRLCEDLAHLRSREDDVVVALAADVAIDTDRAIPLAIIVNELVTNALKFGRRGGDSARVAVSLTADTADALALTVADRGPGLPAGFSMDRPPGLGLQLVKALVRQIGGEVALDTGGGGAAFRVRFPAER
jgi:two-component system, sensor histidine kinase PdtaS